MSIIRTFGFLVAVVGSGLPLTMSCQVNQPPRSGTVPFALDHSRMIVEAEIQRFDGTWRAVRLWVDTGNPELLLSGELAHDLGISSAVDGSTLDQALGEVEVEPPAGLRIGGLRLRVDGVTTEVIFEHDFLFTTMHIDANLPSTVLKNYQVIFDYPQLQMTIGEPGTLRPRGDRCSAQIHPSTGIVQMEAVVAGEEMSFALDNGAPYSFIDDESLERISTRQPGWPRSEGAVGYANIWGWWPEEARWPVIRVPRF